MAIIESGNAGFFKRLSSFSSDLPENHPLLVTILLFVIMKAVLLSITIFFILAFETVVVINGSIFITGNPVIDVLGTELDSYHYMLIAKYGYVDPFNPMETRFWAFPPLFPLTIRLLVYFSPLPLTYPVAALLAANFFSLLSLIAFFSLSKIYSSDRKSIISTLLFAFFPPVFVYGSVAYSEHLFLLFFILSWYFFEKKNFSRSGFFLALASLTRFPGVLIFIIYTILYLRRKKVDAGNDRIIGSLLSIPLFPLLLTIKIVLLISHGISLVNTIWTEKMSLLEKKRSSMMEKVNRSFDMDLSLLLIWGIIPVIWLVLVDQQAPLTLAENHVINWDSRFVFPFASLIELVTIGEIAKALVIFLFIGLFILLGIMELKRRPDFMLLVVGQVFFYSSFVGITAHKVTRYLGTVFHANLLIAEKACTDKQFYLFLLISSLAGLINLLLIIFA